MQEKAPGWEEREGHVASLLKSFNGSSQLPGGYLYQGSQPHCVMLHYMRLASFQAASASTSHAPTSGPLSMLSISQEHHFKPCLPAHVLTKITHVFFRIKLKRRL